MRTDLLRKIRNVLAEVDPATFDMSWWWGKKPGCGCAVGHAWQRGVFAGTGLTLKGYDRQDGYLFPHLTDETGNKSYFTALCCVLEMDRDTAEFLFDPEQYPADEEGITPEDVIARIDLVLKENEHAH